jgi:hypothetical protein
MDVIRGFAEIGGAGGLDPAGVPLGVAAALAVQQGGTLSRINEVRRGQEEGFRACGIDVHGSPPESSRNTNPR